MAAASSTPVASRQPHGRPPATSHAAIEEAAFRLFEERGFDDTTVDDIAAAAGIGRRTLFRYFPSKFDIPWGQFDASLVGLRETLDAMPEDLPLWQAVHEGVVRFNTFDASVVEQHRARMRLILGTPDLQAHSFLMYRRWREVIAGFVAARTGQSVDDPLPVTAGHVALALALASYDQWLSADGGVPLEQVLDRTMAQLRSFLSDDA